MKRNMPRSRWWSIILFIVIILYLVFIFRSWLGYSLISAGDLHYLHKSYLDQLISWPQIWHDANKLPSLYNLPILIVSGILSRAGLSFQIVERLVWFYPFVFFSFFGAYALSRLWMRSHWSYVAGLFYTANTYSLMIIGGGQMGVALGYAFAPWVFHAAFKLCARPTMRGIFYAAFLLTIQTVFDLRIAYVTCGGLAFLLVILAITRQIKFTQKTLVSLLAVLLLTCLLQSYWILPYIFYSKSAVSGLESEYLKADSLSYFSFADFSHTFSWLHPNWPENIFGKTYFLFPQFLLFPILAFGSMFFFIKKNRNTTHDKTATIMSGFGLVLLVGAFLSKGVNPPFGFLYQYLFTVVPGFFMFRDPTKFYTLISLSYSMIIPIGGFVITQWASQRTKESYWNYTISMLMVFFYGILLYPAISGGIGGTFRTTVYPEVYHKLQQLLSADERKNRVLWIPERSRFGYFSTAKPAINAVNMLKDASPSAVATWLSSPMTQKEFMRYRVQYIIVPHDSEHELFLTNRAYNPAVEAEYHRAVQGAPRLQKLTGFDQLSVMKTPLTCPFIWTESFDGSCTPISFVEHSSTYFTVNQSAPKDGMVVISEKFEQNWVTRGPDGREISSVKTWDNLNSFVVPPAWTSFDIVYKPQHYVDIGVWVSLVTVSLVGGYLFYVSFIAHHKAQ